MLMPVHEPTPWVSSMIVVPKKNGSIRICLDPRDLNKAVEHAHYPLASRPHKSIIFSIFDDKTDFLHIKLDEKSQVSSQPLIHHLEDRGGSGCHLV